MTVQVGRSEQDEQTTSKSEERPVERAPEWAEQRVILRDVSWETYECVLAANEDRSVPRLTYDRGDLEFLSPSTEHEIVGRHIAIVVGVVAEELGINVLDVGSTTFRRKDLGRGFEPDACFYVQNEERVRGKMRLDLTVDPPPDLVIEVDITSRSLDKFPIYAQFGVDEIWHHNGKRLAFFKREGEEYVEVAASVALPSLTSAIVSDFIEESKTLERLVWVRNVREWARRQAGGAGERQA
jgi:Uma2 family endonuclease